MCGITGFWNFDGRQVALPVLKRMADTIYHRGPDAEGYLLSDGVRCDLEQGHVGLASRRLAIIDLSPAGRQPMADDSRTVWVVFNGEIYNFQELRVELERQGHRFVTRTDTEVIIHAYKQWGIACVGRFNGMFAIGIYDARARKLFLIRDRLGVKPLYYYIAPRALVFGSELKPLMAFPDFPKALDRAALAQYLTFQYVPCPRTIFERTRKVHPGHYVCVSEDGTIAERAYWDAAAFVGDGVSRNGKGEAAYLEELAALLDSSVRYRMISDVPLGAFLSGGIDSSLVVAAMQAMSPTPVKTFSIGFEESAFDEAPYARAVAKHLGTEHHELYVRPKQALDLLPKIAEFYDEPFGDTVTLATMMLSSLARSHVTVSLSGDGGDELFGGYTRYKMMAQLERARRLPHAVRAALGLLEHLPAGPLRRRGRWITPRSDLSRAYLDVMTVWDEASVGALAGTPRVDLTDSLFLRTFSQLGGRPVLDVVSLVDIKTYLADCILTKLDRASMSVSLEARTPYLDYRLVEFCLRLPGTWKIRGDAQKYLLKRLLGQRLPKALFERPKHGFNMPLASWLRGELKSLAAVHLDPAALRRQGLFDPAVVGRVVREHFDGARDHYPKIYSLIVFQLWCARYLAT